MPRIHPLIDLCNAASLAFAIPIAALDASRIAWPLQVRPAAGSETYLAFSGEAEHPEPEEISFVDARGQAHARRWTHRQSGLSAVRDATASVLIVAEGLHPSAAQYVPRLVDALSIALREVWKVEPRTSVLTAEAPSFSWGTP